MEFLLVQLVAISSCHFTRYDSGESDCPLCTVPWCPLSLLILKLVLAVPASPCMPDAPQPYRWSWLITGLACPSPFCTGELRPGSSGVSPALSRGRIFPLTCWQCFPKEPVTLRHRQVQMQLPELVALVNQRGWC